MVGTRLGARWIEFTLSKGLTPTVCASGVQGVQGRNLLGYRSAHIVSRVASAEAPQKWHGRSQSADTPHLTSAFEGSAAVWWLWFRSLLEGLSRRGPMGSRGCSRATVRRISSEEGLRA